MIGLIITAAISWISGAAVGAAIAATLLIGKGESNGNERTDKTPPDR